MTTVIHPINLVTAYLCFRGSVFFWDALYNSIYKPMPFRQHSFLYILLDNSADMINLFAKTTGTDFYSDVTMIYAWE